MGLRSPCPRQVYDHVYLPGWVGLDNFTYNPGRVVTVRLLLSFRLVVNTADRISDELLTYQSLSDL